MVKDFSTRIDPLYQHTTVETAILGHPVYYYLNISKYTFLRADFILIYKSYDKRVIIFFSNIC